MSGSQQLISINSSSDKLLIEKIKKIANKENRTISEMILHFVKLGYEEYITRNIERTESNMNVVSLFAGAGGMDLGLEWAGFKVIWANEFDKSACDTYETNFKGVYVERGDVKKVEKFPSNVELVVGGYPCQGFSLAGKRLVTDERNFLYKEFLRCLKQVRPKFFMAENVKGMATMANGQVIDAMVEEYKQLGYNVKYKLVNAKDYGVPQDRERVFIVGVREDIEFEYRFPEITHGEGFDLKPYVTMKDAIGYLKKEEVGEIWEGGFSSRYLSRNRKRNWNEVSFCIQASGRHAPLHPSGEPMIKVDQDKWILPSESFHRRLSVLEVAIIQTFPPNFVFKGSTNDKYKQIGNAVPPLLAKIISEPIAEFLNNEKLEAASDQIIDEHQLEELVYY